MLYALVIAFLFSTLGLLPTAAEAGGPLRRAVPPRGHRRGAAHLGPGVRTLRRPRVVDAPADPGGPTPSSFVTRPRWKLPALLVLGALVMQAAWILALPPFRGADEFDHAYRAASVAHGEFIADAGPTTQSRGRLVEAPRDLIDAATPVCESYPYTNDELCTPGQSVGNGYSTVASGAGRYNPLFYGAIGFPPCSSTAPARCTPCAWQRRCCAASSSHSPLGR